MHVLSPCLPTCQAPEGTSEASCGLAASYQMLSVCGTSLISMPGIHVPVPFPLLTLTHSKQSAAALLEHAARLFVQGPDSLPTHPALPACTSGSGHMPVYMTPGRPYACQSWMLTHRQADNSTRGFLRGPWVQEVGQEASRSCRPERGHQQHLRGASEGSRSLVRGLLAREAAIPAATARMRGSAKSSSSSASMCLGRCRGCGSC